MKYVSALLLATAAFSLMPAAIAQQQSHLNRILESGELRVGTTGDWNPMSFRDPATNDYQGFDIDLAMELAKDMGVEVKFVPTDWKTLINGVIADKYDISSSASVNVKRAQVAGYSQPYYEVGTVPMTLKKNLDQFDGWDSINNAEVTVAVTLGTVFENQARTFFPNASIKTVEAPARDYQEVLANRALVSITSNLEASTLIKTYPELAVISVDEARSRMPLALLMPQSDQVWINYVNHWITLKKANGYFKALEQKWMGMP